MDQTLGNRRRPRFTVMNLTITINGKDYRIFNINEHGVGFLIDSPDDIEIGTEIGPMIVNGHVSARVAGIARHISQVRPSGTGLHFLSGWVCGTEFTTQHDLDGGKLLEEYIAETIEREAEEKEK
ncbi:hypothetical protein [uncultured Desulfosarcina sp.]|uniref:hypothetical protein n=1 Tax=uncultured Desulfosarcina sp. TaxID=218289 RepID=UPI0029C931E1|nr:hypothetical protein [uncultured Desulfosarcina sp.]